MISSSYLSNKKKQWNRFYNLLIISIKQILLKLNIRCLLFFVFFYCVKFCIRLVRVGQGNNRFNYYYYKLLRIPVKAIYHCSSNVNFNMEIVCTRTWIRTWHDVEVRQDCGSHLQPSAMTVRFISPHRKHWWLILNSDLTVLIALHHTSISTTEQSSHW